MFVTTIVVLIINTMPVFTQQVGSCLVGSFIDEKNSIDIKIDAYELKYIDSIENGKLKRDYDDTVAVDYLDASGKLIKRDYKSQNLTEVIDTKIRNNEFKSDEIHKDKNFLRTYYYLAATDKFRDNGGLAERDYYDINGELFAISHYEYAGLRVCYTDYFDCNGKLVGTLYPPLPCLGIYPG